MAASVTPETLTAYEGDQKMVVLDHTVNRAGFYNTDISIQLTLSSCPQQSFGNPAPAPCRPVWATLM